MRAVLFSRDRETCERVTLALRLRWPDAEVRRAETGPQAVDLARHAQPNLTLLDLTSPAGDSLQLIRSARAAFDGALIALTRQPSEWELVEALDAGADDYLSATASSAELVARVRAALRRADPTARAELVARCGNLTIDPERHEAHVSGRELYLTPTEFKLLYHLAQNHGKLVSQEALHELVWGCEEKLYIDSLRKHIDRLRHKLWQSPGAHLRIISVARIGYRLLDSA